MIKLYIFYFVFGAYMLLESWMAWIFSFGGVSLLTYSGLLSSAVLFLIVPGLTLYNVRWASIVGLLFLLCVLPYGIHWLVYFYHDNLTWSILKDGFTQIYLGAIVWCIVTASYSIKYIVNHKQTPNKISIRKYAKFALVFLPLFLVAVFALLDVLIKQSEANSYPVERTAIKSHPRVTLPQILY